MMVQSVTRFPIETATDWRELSGRIKAQRATVGVIGLGYVGLPLAVAFARKGFTVVGYEVSEQKVAQLMIGQSHVLDVPASLLQDRKVKRHFTATTDAKALRKADVIVVCVPTPCLRNREPDLSYVRCAAETIAENLRPGQLIILESTTYPGTTEELMIPVLEKTGLKVDRDFQVAFSPERIDPGNPQYHVENTPKVVGGLGKIAGDLACALYEAVTDCVVRVSSPREAEMAKLIENTFRHVNIALVNELALMAGKLGVNIWEAIDAAASKPFGFMPFYPGPGVGGHCIPIDPHYLSWKAREMGAETSFIELAERINHGMPDHVARMVIDAVNHADKSIRHAQVLLVGVAYKPDIDDMRESPALRIIEALQHYGAVVNYHDPFVPTITVGGQVLTSQPLTSATLAQSDCVVIITPHSCVNLEMIASHAPVIVDTRNAMKAYANEQIIRL